jgi:hypothetical protein
MNQQSSSGSTGSSSNIPDASDQPGGTVSDGRPMSPGDVAPEGTPGTGEGICPRCGGSGSVQGATCPNCEGTGKVVVGIGGA